MSGKCKWHWKPVVKKEPKPAVPVEAEVVLRVDPEPELPLVPVVVTLFPGAAACCELLGTSEETESAPEVSRSTPAIAESRTDRLVAWWRRGQTLELGVGYSARAHQRRVPAHMTAGLGY